jgi:hypothetical protein
MQQKAALYPTIFLNRCIDFLKGDVSVLEDTMERYGALWFSSAYDDLRAGGDRAADVLQQAIQRAADQSESSGNELLLTSDIRTLVAVAEPRFSEFLIGKCDTSSCKHWEEVQERCDASTVQCQPSLIQLHAVVADCLMLPSLDVDVSHRINCSYADAPGVDGIDLAAPVLAHFFEMSWTRWVQQQCPGTSLDLITRMQHEGKGFKQADILASVNKVSP